jgi:cysteine desulfurase
LECNGGDEMIYADNAATTRIDKNVLKNMLPYFEEYYGNPSSLYSFGRKSRKAVSDSRKAFANVLGAKEDEIYFTSCGSESDNWAIKGVAQARLNKGNHIITTEIEHHAILNTCKSLNKNGYHITYLPVNDMGMVSIKDLEAAITDETILISVMFANNEVGTIEPISQIGKIAKERNILFHTDAVQALGHIPINVNEMNIDLLSASAHKFNGPKGVGILYIRQGTTIANYLDGGSQEQKKRAGTENVAGIVGAGIAIQNNIKIIEDNNRKLQELNEYTTHELFNRISGIKINGDSVYRLCGNVNISLPNIEGEALLHLLDLQGICVSTGSACTSGEIEPSHVLTAIGLTKEEANGTIRITYGKNNTFEDAIKLVDTICMMYGKLLNK